MIDNVLWLENDLLLISLSPPFELEGLVSQVTSIFASKLQPPRPEIAVLVDATKFQPPIETSDIKALETFLLSQQTQGVVVVFGLANPIQRLIKLSHFSYLTPTYPIYFEENQKSAIDLLQHLQSVNSSMQLVAPKGDSIIQTKTSVRCPLFNNSQSQCLFQVFMSDTERLRTWREMVDMLFDDGAIVFETVMFAKQHNLSGSSDPKINWHQVIMALLDETDS